MIKRKERIVAVGIVYKEIETIFYCAKLVREGESLEILETSKNITSIVELKKYIGNLPVVISFIGKGIVYTKDIGLYKNSIHDFYSNNYTTQQGEVFSAIARKDFIDTIIEEFTSKGVFIVGVNIGVFIINILYGRVLSNKKVSVYDIELKYDDIDCMDFSKKEGSLDEIVLLGEERKNSFEAFLLATTLSHFYPSKRIESNYNNEKVEKNKEGLKHKNDLKWIGVIGFSIVAFVSLLSILIGWNYEKKLETINSALIKDNYRNVTLKKLKEEEIRKKELVKLSGFLNPNLISYYVNEVVSSVPNSITLSDLNVLPLEGAVEDNEKIDINDSQIRVKGILRDNIKFNNWINDLRNKLKVKNISIQKFKYTENRSIEFEIQIFLR